MLTRQYPQESHDIEDMAAIGKKLNCCQYYQSKSDHDNTDIVLMPYNYVLSPKIRKSVGIDLKNTIIIIDKAHNLSSTAESIMEFEINERDLEMMIKELNQLIQTPGVIYF